MPLEQNVPHPPGTNNVSFHRKQFLAERAGWAAMALYLAWAVLGGFGDGWVSKRRASNAAGSCTVDYQRFGRRDAPFELRLWMELDEPRDRIALHLNREFLDRVKIERVTPAYQSIEADSSGVALLFMVEPEPGAYTFTIEYKPQHVGALHAVLQAEREAEVALDQFVYP
jgi:hypothetical protein